MVGMSSLTALSVLAVDEDKVAPGLLGFLVVAALGVATWFLIRSMNKQLKKIDFDEEHTARSLDERGEDKPTER
jgi:hypothetical protein